MKMKYAKIDDMTISNDRIKTKDEIRESLEIWFKYRDDKDHDFRLRTSIDIFEVESTRVTKFERMDE
jgi:head-tail adaptor